VDRPEQWLFDLNRRGAEAGLLGGRELDHLHRA
jgi:hypothetical protein